MEIDSDSVEESSRLIKCILQGQLEINAVRLNSENRSLNVGYELPQYYPIKLPKCSMKKLIDYVVRSITALDDVDLLNAYESIREPFSTSSFSTPEHISSILFNRKMYFIDTFIGSSQVNDFLKRSFQQRLVLLGTKYELSEVVLVPHGIGCSNCVETLCRKNMLYRDVELVSPQELYENSTYLQQIMPITTYLASVGKELWSPIYWKQIPVYAARIER
ncbi:hypothetical protein FA893_11160 [Photobacterium damselae subsp. piscicida]|nr:hypothetical protein [Photobacterium damselae]OLQ80804.1 hypothetical protein BEI67_12605 [Photobacterium damselae subsp. piscicida]TFZ53877.1 hypothetical protein E4T25_15975 [Photobacterium damselae subsp. piscicida]TJZ90295.1 hypothetical protein FA893_11160 [Photobacterium damselae subsp. piscicida]BBC40540.1 hypothetical protein PDPE_1-01380 [Photobacterium damselae subsp. piscicida]